MSINLLIRSVIYSFASLAFGCLFMWIGYAVWGLPGALAVIAGSLSSLHTTNYTRKEQEAGR